MTSTSSPQPPSSYSESANEANPVNSSTDDVLNETTVSLNGVNTIPGLVGYSNLELIAHGSTAVVFRADQARLNRKVAIKVLLIDDLMTTDVSVQRELDTLVRLSSSPHIVSIIDTGTTDVGQPYIVMEYCDGGSYAQILKDRGPLPVDEVVEVGIKIGEALHAAHEVGIIHRDVKPPNILRSRFGPALTDFGIAYATDGAADTETLQKLTPHHASPETLLQHHQSGQSDLYSLASTMWNLLAGKPPFANPGQDPEAFRQRVIQTPVPPIPRDDVPGWLQNEIARAMAKHPSERHPTALAFAETLRLHLARSSAALWGPGMGENPEALTVYQDQTSMRTQNTSPPPHPLPYGPGLPPNSAPPVTAAGAPGYGYPPWVGAPSAMSSPPAVSPGINFSPSPISGPPVVSAESVRAQLAEPIPPLYPPPPQRPQLQEEDETDDTDTPTWRRPLITAALVGIILGLIAIIGLAVLKNNQQAEQADQDSKPKASPSLINNGAPTEVRLNDRGSSVILTWHDTTKGKGSFLIVGAQTGEKTGHMGTVKRGETTFTLSGLNDQVDYCFQVVAVLSTETLAPSEAACTSRLGGRGGS